MNHSIKLMKVIETSPLSCGELWQLCGQSLCQEREQMPHPDSCVSPCPSSLLPYMIQSKNYNNFFLNIFPHWSLSLPILCVCVMCVWCLCVTCVCVCMNYDVCCAGKCEFFTQFCRHGRIECGRLSDMHQKGENSIALEHRQIESAFAKCFCFNVSLVGNMRYPCYAEVPVCQQ